MQRPTSLEKADESGLICFDKNRPDNREPDALGWCLIPIAKSRMHDAGQFLTHTWQHSSDLVECSLILLLAMFIWTLADHAHRGWRFLAAKWQSRKFLSAGASFLKHGAWDDVLVLAEVFKKSPVAAIYLGGLQRFRNERGVLDEQAVDAASREARVARNRMHERLRQGLNRMATISTTAPLVGLFGTTIGILDSFGGYIGSASGYISFMATNISNALVPTAVGLLIGVLATWSYNWRSDRLAACNAEMEIASAELLKYLEQQRRGSPL